MTNRADDHLEFEKICWMAKMERDPNELVELSLRTCESTDRRMSCEADNEDAAFDRAMFPESNERRVEC